MPNHAAKQLLTVAFRISYQIFALKLLALREISALKLVEPTRFYRAQFMAFEGRARFKSRAKTWPAEGIDGNA